MISSLKHKSVSVSEPNLIPLLDFMLVLVVMFVLLAAPPLQQAIKLPLPEVKKGAAAIIKKEIITVSLLNKNSIYIADKHFTGIEEAGNYLKSKSQTITEITLAINKHLEVDTLLKFFAISKTLGIKTANIQVNNERIS